MKNNKNFNLEKIVEICNAIISRRTDNVDYFALLENNKFCIISFLGGRWGISNYTKECWKMEKPARIKLHSYEVVLPFPKKIVEDILPKLDFWPFYLYR